MQMNNGCSDTHTALATSSPPTLKPCSARLMKNRRGAHAPMVSYLGVRAMARQDTAMSSTVHISAGLRPRVSVSQPKKMPPRGLRGDGWGHEG
jgi:hypothetical protein